MGGLEGVGVVHGWTLEGVRGGGEGGEGTEGGWSVLGVVHERLRGCMGRRG